jgi:hypothetical protein
MRVEVDNHENAVLTETELIITVPTLELRGDETGAIVAMTASNWLTAQTEQSDTCCTCEKVG